MQSSVRSRVLVVCQGYPPFYGGAEHAAAYLTREMQRAGTRSVHVLTSDIGGRLPAEETLDGIPITRIPCRKREWTRHSVPELLSFCLSAVRRLQALHERLQPDYILAHFTMPAGCVALAWRRFYGIPYTVILQGSDVPGYNPGRFFLLHPVMRMVARAVWRHADHVVAVSSTLAWLAARSWPEGRVTVIPNGVDTDLFHPPATPRAGNPLRLVVTAQLIERKGIHFLLQALAGLDREDRDACEVLLCGTGPYQATLARQVRESGLEGRVRFEGLLKREVVAQTLREADLFVLPSLQEGLPLALLEAMATGLAAIATPVGDIPSVMRDNENGLLVPPGDALALRQALVRLIRDPALRTRLGQAARKTAETLAWPRIWGQYANLLQPQGKTSGAGLCASPS